jgi:hypothetical protein
MFVYFFKKILKQVAAVYAALEAMRVLNTTVILTITI